uniref:DNA polymerase alpha subunit B n=1 Tax=Hyaloperonospora arabidopsidis (strain Emoy2) TaxID=559515 RepID=M4C1F4_HYAAE
MAAQWDAYSMNQQLVGAATTDDLVAFRSYLNQQKLKTKEKATTAPSQHRRNMKTPVMKRETESQDRLESLYTIKSPEGKHHARSFSSPPGSNKVQRTNEFVSPSTMQFSPGINNYENRLDAGKTVSEFNAHLKTQMEELDAGAGCVVTIALPFPSRNQSPNATYMYTPQFQRTIALDEQLVEYEELVKEQFKLEELKPVGDPSPAQVTVVGRIVCEAAEGKLNSSVVQIEGSRKTCGGQRVLLDLSKVPNFQLFPGKIVALEGVFSDTRSPMAVRRFLEPVPTPPSTTSPARIKEIHTERGKPVRVLVACGPFTTSSNVDYLPLNDLLQIAIDQKPDVLVLASGRLIAVLTNLMTLLNKVLAQDERIQIVLVPSLRDANHHYVYPQPPLDKKKACEAFEAPEYTKLSSNELYRAQSRDPNRLLRLCEQVIDQRSYYPIFPPPPSSEAPIDLRYTKQFQIEETPDILLLPSVLNRFCGRAKDSICINPGQLCKGESGGTFAHISILPLSNDNIESAIDDKCAHFVPDRTFVEIKRI